MMQNKFTLTSEYKSELNVLETEVAIKELKDFFERGLAKELNLMRVSAPLFVLPESGLNDSLNGVERPVEFHVKDMDANVQIVHSLAKWKRMALYKYGFSSNSGLYTDMNAIRRDEELDNLHSIYVDQWDWELILDKGQRNVEFLKSVVRKIYKVFKNTEEYICNKYTKIDEILPEEIFFITSQELECLYPDISPKERENKICKDRGAVFIIGIGGILESGNKHDGRAADYDDWKLNGDILFWHPVLNCALEVSSMGIRVDKSTLLEQLQKSKEEEKLQLKFHKMLVEGILPDTIGGGIGQSRICMFFLRKAHIGEVQASVWSEDVIKECNDKGIELL